MKSVHVFISQLVIIAGVFIIVKFDGGMMDTLGCIIEVIGCMFNQSLAVDW